MSITPTFIGGGKDNIIENNLFINSEPSIRIDSRGSGWAKYMYKQLFKKLNLVPYLSDIWKVQYPSLQDILIANTRNPVGNIVKNNVFYDPKWSHISLEAQPYIKIINNHVLVGQTPTLEYQPLPPLLEFKAIPFTTIGLKRK